MSRKSVEADVNRKFDIVSVYVYIYVYVRGGEEHSATPGSFLYLDHPTKSDVTSGKIAG